MKFIKWFFGLFSPYVDSSERRVDRFFKSVKSSSSFAGVRRRLLKLMQEDLIVVNVWLERKFKGYKYLNKGNRRDMYRNVEAIRLVFDDFVEKNHFDVVKVRELVEAGGLVFPNGDEEKVVYLFAIMEFLKPGRFYTYIKTASFGKLLRDPRREKMKGDCNQIVTLYIYLYSLRYPLEDLEIKLLPKHVCLHFRGLDVEATNGTFQNYQKDCEVLPVTEIISTNLLDLADFREEVQDIAPRVVVKSAQLAYAISSLKSLVEKNLKVAYRNLALAAMHVGNFKSARFYAEQVGDSKFLRELKHNEAVFCYQKNKMERALAIAKDLGDKSLIKACYGKMYNQLADKVKNVKTLKEAKRNKSNYKKMLDFARKMGNDKLVDSLKGTLNSL